MMNKKRADVIEGSSGNEGDFTPDPMLSRRLEWFRDLKFGLFMHWGAYCQWGCIESWPLVEEDTWARPDDLAPWQECDRDLDEFRRRYWKLNETFDPSDFNPDRWANAAEKAGMKYVVFTTKHHDGFCMFDTQLTDYKITATPCPFNRREIDPTHEVFETFRQHNFGIGAYFSKSDWRHPDYWDPERLRPDRNPNYDTSEEPEKWDRFVRFVHGQVEELMTGYGPVDILWLDGGQVRPPHQDIRMDELARMARSYQPELLIADRTVGGQHENYLTPEQEVPDDPPERAWESCITMGTGWSYRPDDDYKPAGELIQLLVDVVSKGGNLLLNIGPSPEGRFAPEAHSRLEEIGAWMKINGEAIHGSRGVPETHPHGFSFTRKDEQLYVFWSQNENGNLPVTLNLPVEADACLPEVELLGYGRLDCKESEKGLHVSIPPHTAAKPPTDYVSVFRTKGDGELTVKT
ncbi:MAG: alpha-L-fucosidase [Planctomycetes bacterium]|nr:alpha-L-fucosidase [Planctomycetota bacterium]